MISGTGGAQECRPLVRDDITAVFEYFQALGFTWFPGSVDLPTVREDKGDDTFVPTSPREAIMDLLCGEVRECTRCRLHRERKQAVCGEGALNARLMFIGEAPGKEEDLQGLPFVGDAGMLLTRLIEKMGLKRKDVYIANIIKCRPPQNRDPEEEEITSCMAYIERQIETIRPEIIVTLGRIALQSLMRDTRLKITAVRGSFFDFRGIPVLPTFHPAYLLRNPSDKWLTWSDMQKVLERLGSC